MKRGGDDRTDAQSLLALDRVVHEPARLAILTVLASSSEAEFKFLESALGLTAGNLASHVAKLEGAGYVEVTKTFRDRVPVTSYRITDAGRRALDGWWRLLRAGMPAGER